MARTATCHSHLQRLAHQLLIIVLAHGPADHLTRKEIQDHRHIQPALPGPDVGGIAHPCAIGSLDLKLPVEQVGGDRCPLGARRSHLLMPTALGCQLHLPHQASHPLLGTAHAPSHTTLHAPADCHRPAGAHERCDGSAWPVRHLPARARSACADAIHSSHSRSLPAYDTTS